MPESWELEVDSVVDEMRKMLAEKDLIIGIYETALQYYADNTCDVAQMALRQVKKIRGQT